MNDKKEKDSELEILKKELEEAKKQNQEYLSGWQRALADYSNFQKETEKRKKEIVEFANAEMISDILPIYNNLKLALKHANGDDEFLKGIEQIKKQFANLLRGFGIEEIATVGEKFDPNVHEAIECASVDGYQTGYIYDEISAGYKMGDKVLEPAKVKVAK